MTEDLRDGFHVGGLYILKVKDRTEIIPRDQISYVSASAQDNIVLIIFGVALVLIGLAGIGRLDQRGIGLMLLIGIVCIVAYFATRRSGVLIASSGGKIFFETRGRNRLAHLNRIYRDLADHHGFAARTREGN